MQQCHAFTVMTSVSTEIHEQSKHKITQNDSTYRSINTSPLSLNLLHLPPQHIQIHSTLSIRHPPNKQPRIIKNPTGQKIRRLNRPNRPCIYGIRKRRKYHAQILRCATRRADAIYRHVSCKEGREECREGAAESEGTFVGGILEGRNGGGGGAEDGGCGCLEEGGGEEGWGGPAWEGVRDGYATKLI
jgi:hypothetical protein